MQIADTVQNPFRDVRQRGSGAAAESGQLYACCDCDVVRRADLIGRDIGCFDGDQFVAGRDDSDSERPARCDDRATRRCQHCHFGCGNSDAGLEHDVPASTVATLRMNEAPRIGDCIIVDDRDLVFDSDPFDRNHGIGSLRKHCPRHDTNAAVVGGILFCRFPCGLHGGDSKPTDSTLERRTVYGNAVHCDPIERRQIAFGADVFAQYPTAGLIERDSFNRCRRQVLSNQRLGVGDRRHCVSVVRAATTVTS